MVRRSSPLNISRFGRFVRLSCDARYSIRSSALVFSSARSKFSSANDTLSVSRCSSSENSGVNVSFSIATIIMTPTTCPRTNSGNAAPARACVKRLATRVGEIIVDDDGLARADRHTAGPASFRMGLIDRQPHLARTGRGRSGSRYDLQIIAFGSRQRDGSGGELAAVCGGLAHQIEQLAAGACAHDRLVGRTERREHARQALLLFLGLRLLVGAVEIIEGERNVLRKALQQPDQFRAEHTEFAGEEHNDTDGSAVFQQRQCRARSGATVANHLVEMSRGAEIGQVIVADARLPRTKRRAGNALSLGPCRVR